MRESEAEDFIRRFQQIQAELKQKQEELEKSDPQAADEQIKQGRQEQEGMLERIKKLMEEMQQKKPQQQQGQKKPQSQEQQELQKKLNELMKKMREKGMDPGKLDDAEKSMGDAKKELDKNAPGDAVPKQDEALDQLREGEEQMKQQMKKVPGKGPGPGEGQGSEHTNRQPTDIMGRPVPRSPQELGPITSQNLSRERREAIHKLLENAKLPPIQREYLERLLNGGKPKSMAPQP